MTHCGRGILGSITKTRQSAYFLFRAMPVAISNVYLSNLWGLRCHYFKVSRNYIWQKINPSPEVKICSFSAPPPHLPLSLKTFRHCRSTYLTCFEMSSCSILLELVGVDGQCILSLDDCKSLPLFVNVNPRWQKKLDKILELKKKKNKPP